MGEDKSSISAARSYLEIGEYWDSHDSSDLWNEVPAAEFDMSAESQEVYYPLDMDLALEMRAAAKRMGVLPKTLLAKWVREKLSEMQQERANEAAALSSSQNQQE